MCVCMLYACMHASALVLWDTYGGQMTACGSLFSPFTEWVLGIKLKWSALVKGTVTH